MHNATPAVLVVDDDPILLEGIQDALDMVGANPVTCKTREEALQHLQQQPHHFIAVLFNLVIKDIKTSLFIRQIRNHAHHIKIYIMTYREPAEVSKQLENESVHGVLYKPFGFDELIDLFEP